MHGDSHIYIYIYIFNIYIQYIYNFVPILYITLILSVFIIKIGGFLTVDCSIEETAICIFSVISSNINKVTIQR